VSESIFNNKPLISSLETTIPKTKMTKIPEPDETTNSETPEPENATTSSSSTTATAS